MDYQEQKRLNEETFRKGALLVRPDIVALMDALDNSGIDHMILFYTLLALDRVVTGTAYGNVTIFVENGVVTFIKSDESRKVNLPAKKNS